MVVGQPPPPLVGLITPSFASVVEAVRFRLSLADDFVIETFTLLGLKPAKRHDRLTLTAAVVRAQDRLAPVAASHAITSSAVGGESVGVMRLPVPKLVANVVA